MRKIETKEGAGLFRGAMGAALELDLKELSAEGEFECYLSTFGNVDLGRDMVMPGAFTKSLQRRPAAKVKMLLFHDVRRPCGVWTDMVEDQKGLRAKGRLLLGTQDGRETYELMRAGALDSTSIGYKTVVDEYDRSSNVRKLIELDLYEGSVVTFPMNERATVSTVKTAQDFTAQDWRDLEAALRDEGLSRADRVKAVSGFKNWFQRDAGAPDQSPRDEVSPGDLAAIRAAFADLAERIRA